MLMHLHGRARWSGAVRAVLQDFPLDGGRRQERVPVEEIEEGGLLRGLRGQLKLVGAQHDHIRLDAAGAERDANEEAAHRQA